MASIDAELDGGNNGHLDLNLTAAKYVLVLVIVYVRPVNQGSVAPVRAIQYETIRLRDDYNRAIRLFREVTGVKIAIVKQIMHG